MPWTKDVSAFPKSSRSRMRSSPQLVAWAGGAMATVLQTDFSIALLKADSATPRRTVTAPSNGYCFGGPDCDAVPMQVPLPDERQHRRQRHYVCDATNNDCHVLVYERDRAASSTNSTRRHQTATGFTAYGAFVWDLDKAVHRRAARGPVHVGRCGGPADRGAAARRRTRWRAGTVAHALRFILPNARMKRQVYVRPATHAGGPSSTHADAPPYGVRFRLKATFDETPYNANARVILRAMKTYGMILSDGGNIALTFADDRLSAAKWSSLGITAQTFNSIGVGDFEVVDLGGDSADLQLRAAP